MMCKQFKGSSVSVKFHLKSTVIAVIAVLQSACGGSDHSGIIVTDSANTPDQNQVASPPVQTTPEVTQEVTPGVRTGVFIDSQVANLSYVTASGSGKTNRDGEFYYLPGENISFSLGGISFPAVVAKEVITPMDLFQSVSVTDAPVVNLSRLLQTLDTDGDPDNGIELPDETDFLAAGSINFAQTDNFERQAVSALQSIGLTDGLVDAGVAVTHLSNSLLQQDLIALDQLSTEAVQFDGRQNDGDLSDLDGDGIADVFDWDDDNDGVLDTVDQFPQDPGESLDVDGDGIGNSADSDDDNDGVDDTRDAFPLVPTESVDTDGDGLGNTLDTDDDNDGVPDVFDAFPLDYQESLDTDSDGIGNRSDDDDDNDGVSDKVDAFPLLSSESRDTDGDGIGDNFDQDDDNDGVPDYADMFPTVASEQLDTDNDGKGNNADSDDDNDGLLDSLDAFPLLSSESEDSDGDGLGNNFDQDDDNDGVADSIDAFPTNPAEYLDTDGDGIGDNEDTDDDNDGLDDASDPSPLSENNLTDIDGDGFPDVIDDDNDNDGVHDALDQFPQDSTEWSDNDKDGIGDNADTDDDNDGTPDTEDALPLNPAETADTDGDGIGDNADDDSDNDGVNDTLDAFPLNPLETDDTDGDGIGNNEDIDDDDDGMLDVADAFPLNPFETSDLDGDGIGDNSDPDRDNDGVDNWRDAFPEDPLEYRDLDEDGIGDNADTDDDNDGTPDHEDPYPDQPYYNADTDGDGEYDQFDRDDDNDGVLDDDDQLPKDPNESKDSDADGIGDNADTDDDNDGVADTDDFAPLNANCSSEEDAIGGQCISDFLTDVEFIANLGDSAYLFSSSAQAAMQISLASGDVLADVDLSASATADDVVTSVLHHPLHDRIYVGFSSGVIVHFSRNSTDATYHHTLAEKVSSMAFAGELLLAQEGSSRGDVYILDREGVLLSQQDFVFDSIEHTAWQHSQNRLLYIRWSDRLQARPINQTDGSLGDLISFSSPNDVEGPIGLSPDESLLLAANGRTFVLGDSISQGGIISTRNFIDFVWNDAGELISVAADGAQTVIEHRTSDYIVADSLTIDGEPLALLENNGTFYAVTSADDGVAIEPYVPSDDSDNDLVLNVDDAFPRDPAASLDSDSDGSPDSWNDGYSEQDSTTGLVLDAYPQDPACYLAVDGNGTHCFYDLIVPRVAPTTVINEGNLTYLHYADGNLIFIRDNATDTYLTPIHVGEDNGTVVTPPATVALHTEHNRLYLGYSSGAVTYLDLDSEQPAEAYFTTLAEAVRGIAQAGQFVMAVDDSGAWYSHHYYDVDGTLTVSEDWNRNSGYFAYNSTLNRLYFFRDGTSPNDLHYEDIDQSGNLVGDGETPYHGDYDFDGPILISPDDSTVLLGAGEYYDATTLERIGSVSRSFDYGVYLDDGRVAILKENGPSDSIVAFYDTNYAPIEGVTTLRNAQPAGISYYGNTLTVITFSDSDGLVYHDYENP